MLELARKLADNDEKFFGGWVVAGVEVHIKGAAQNLVNNTLLAKAYKSILQVLGTDAAGDMAKELRVFLLLPKRPLGTRKGAIEVIEGEPVAAHSFTTKEIADYVAYTGDQNVIHQGEHPIVPGLHMLAWLQQELKLEQLDWRVSFLSPVYAGDELKLYRLGNKLAAYVQQDKVFTITEL